MQTEWPRHTVTELQATGVLLVEDGNHGEYRPRLEEFVENGQWYFIRAADMDSGRILFESAQKINNAAFARIRKGVGKGGDVLFSHKGTVGKLAIASLDAPPFVCSPQTTFWRTLDERKLDRRFLFYYMQSGAFSSQWMSRKGETDMADYVSLTTQRQFEVLVPPSDEQRAIAAVLGSLDDKIEQNRRTARTLERLAWATFKAWFVDFEPVKAKAAGAAGFPGMPPAAFAALPDRLTDSVIGPVPHRWAVRPLSEVVTLTMGQSPKSEYYNTECRGLPFHQGVTDYGFRFPAHRVYCTTEGRLAVAGDVLLSVRAPVGRINVADRQLILGRGLAGMRHLDDQQSFLLYQMLHTFAEEDAIGDGTIYKAVNRDFLSAMPLLAPPPAFRLAFEANARPMDELIVATENESSKLAALRDYLLPRLLSRRVRVGRWQGM
jgi:type I restriction enzyme S subunit